MRVTSRIAPRCLLVSLANLENQRKAKTMNTDTAPQIVNFALRSVPLEAGWVALASFCGTCLDSYLSKLLYVFESDANPNNIRAHIVRAEILRRASF
jgi:hypothetical protein